ncbi:3-ketoacyl-ACP reductase [Salinicoccus halodurans]|uniref:Diacetyl reductase [(S)-acetoin forming] n=1 Tax=Salinicoccus halodurans TaxID=407035 RepID=A0A0F7HJ51_9STAP|nr:3-ketoacyl-ACP reductase [Salinicoccus halodurans]AKG73062.1 3-ketoacyl-ACP reductase [Salinicoccus halodurans]SFK78322.1 3-oxoacyl-[acyl-carrier protein] reductase [Salinicoccus halodurans]
MQDIKGKNAVITGGTRGIGLATAHALAAEGVNVAVIGRNRDTLSDAVDELNRHDVQVIGANGDVSSREEVDSMIASISESFSSFDILINNAGIMGHTPFLDSSEEEFRKMMDVNVFGPYYMMQAVLPQMTAQQKGDVINISSMSGLKGTPGSSLYSATKFAVIGMTEGIMQEMRKHNIRVSYLTPSAVLTDLIGEARLEEDSMTHAEDIADIIVSQLKLNQRTFIKTSQMWATNPIPKEK